MLKRRKQLSARNQRERGLQLIEAAFIMPIMVLLLGTVAEFGRYFHLRSTMLRATMAGAVYMSDKAKTNSEIVAAQNMAACGQPNCTNVTLLYTGVTSQNHTVTFPAPTVVTSGSVTTIHNYVVVATNNVIYRPAIALSQMTNPNRSWTAIPINVQTRMRYFGS